MKFRPFCRLLHRDLSYLFAGMLLIYALSGFMLNHKRDFNADYAISRTEYSLNESFPKAKTEFSKAEVLTWLEPLQEATNYTKHYFPSDEELKVFLKGGSSLVVNLQNGKAVYESVRKRPVLNALNRLHYNPGRAWTWFSDLFLLALVVITLSGLIMLKGPKGLWGRGGIELLIGLLIPLLFLL